MEDVNYLMKHSSFQRDVTVYNLKNQIKGMQTLILISNRTLEPLL